MKEELIRDIVDREWRMFSQVENQGGKASCQSRPRTFEIMRRSQFLSWTEEILGSYLQDLKDAEKAGRNLCTEKYAYMMEKTDPAGYEKIRKRLPVISGEKADRIEEIVAVNILWEEETDRRFPRIRANGRPLRSEQDSFAGVSVETYLRCELKTYSEKTIRLLCEYTAAENRSGHNLAEEILDNTMKAYGYASAKQAEEAIENDRRS